MTDQENKKVDFYVNGVKKICDIDVEGISFTKDGAYQLNGTPCDGAEEQNDDGILKSISEFIGFGPSTEESGVESNASQDIKPGSTADVKRVLHLLDHPLEDDASFVGFVKTWFEVHYKELPPQSLEETTVLPDLAAEEPVAQLQDAGEWWNENKEWVKRQLQKNMVTDLSLLGEFLASKVPGGMT